MARRAPRIDLVSYINLDERTDRRAHMTELLRKCPYPTRRIRAIRLKRPPEAFGFGMTVRLHGAAGVASIFLSHRKALLDALGTVDGGGFVLLEDDVHLGRRFWTRDIAGAMPPEGYDVSFVTPRYRPPKRLGRNHTGPRCFLHKPLGDGLVELSGALKSYIITGAHCLIFRDVDAIAKAVRLMDRCRSYYNVDEFYLRRLRACGIHVDEVRAGDFGSDHKIAALEDHL